MQKLSKEHKAVADTLKVLGQQIRVACCGGSKSAIITHTEKGFSFHCFRCGGREFTRHGTRSISAIKAARAFQKTKLTLHPELPDDFTLSIPPRYCTWFTQYGVSPECAESYEFGWSEDMHRIIIPVYWNGSLLTYQARAVLPDQQPKYLTPSHVDVSRGVFLAGNPQSNILCLTEDILSAIKVGRADQYAAALMGCEISVARAAWILKQGKKILIWLDPDKAGQNGANKIARKLELYGIPHRNIVSEHDPKGHTLDEIREYIGGAI